MTNSFRVGVLVALAFVASATLGTAQDAPPATPPIQVTVQQPAMSDAQLAADAARQDRSLSIQDDMARATRWLTVLSGVQIAVSVFAFLVTLAVTRRAADAATTNARAAEKSAHAAKRGTQAARTLARIEKERAAEAQRAIVVLQRGTWNQTARYFVANLGPGAAVNVLYSPAVGPMKWTPLTPLSAGGSSMILGDFSNRLDSHASSEMTERPAYLLMAESVGGHWELSENTVELGGHVRCRIRKPSPDQWTAAVAALLAS